MGINGGRNQRGIEGDPSEEGLYLRVNVSMPPSLLKRLDKYMKDEYKYTYEKSLYSMKPILKTSEVDDSRPTVIRAEQPEEGGPKLLSVLSGKINTVYDLDEYL